MKAHAIDPSDAPVPAPILPAHTRPPRRRDGLLPRPALVARVAQAAVENRLVLISAASGFGKTTLLADTHRHVTQQGARALWLSVVEGEQDAGWLARALVDQLARLYDAEPAAGDDFGTLASRLVGDQPVIVMIDNWNMLESDAVNALFDRILAECEGLAHFVITSRTIPGFLFETLRLAGSFAGFTSRDLAFSTQEANDVLAGTAPDSPRLFSLIERTEGWPAGVQLLRLALEQQAGGIGPAFDFSGTRADVAEYLGKAFFRHAPADRRAFLCNIAVLDELSADILACALDDPSAAATFHAVARDNLFLSETHDRSGRLRFHSLFRDFLLSQHAQHATAPKTAVLQRAMDYHAGRGERELAIRYAIQADQRDAALALLAEYGPMLSGEGRVFQYAQWVDILRQRGVATTPSIDHWYCWSLVFSGRWREGVAFAAGNIAPVDAEIATIIAAFSDDQPALSRALDGWLAQADRGGPFRTAVMQCAIAIAGMAHGDVERAL
ncbi:MAG: hypothetical protein ACKOUM_09295, partial [Sphingopyxis sp.]